MIRKAALTGFARKLGLALLVLAAALGLTHVANSASPSLGPKPPGAIRLATHNVHYIVLRRAEGRWSVTDFERRKAALDSVFKEAGADIVAFQEMESFGRGDTSGINLARDWLLDQNPGYAAAASGDPAEFPSTQPIFYRREAFAVTDQGWFFFSDTPEVIYSRTFNGSYPAFASWAEFVPVGGGTPFRVVNVHFDSGSRTNRMQSARLVASRIGPWIEAGQTVLLLGDLNALHGWTTPDILRGAGLAFARTPGTTFHFDRGLHLFGAIDHIGGTPGVALAPPVVLRSQPGGVWPSDHYPVVTDAVLP